MTGVKNEVKNQLSPKYLYNISINNHITATCNNKRDTEDNNNINTKNGLVQACPKSGPRAKSGPRSKFIRPAFKVYPARSLVMKYRTLVYYYLASSINILHLPTRDQQHFTQHNPQPARIHGQWFSIRLLT